MMSWFFLLPGRRPGFPPPAEISPEPDGLVALGGDLHPELLLEAYRKGIFPWEGSDPIPWFSPDPRLILRPAGFKARRSLQKTRRKGIYEVRIDTDFPGTMRECARMRRPGQRGSWITEGMIRAYTVLHERGIAHSVETWRDGQRVGGLYGLTLGKAFFGESMFALEPDTSKLALWTLCERLTERDFLFIDCQQDTPHLRSLGAFTVSREFFLAQLEEALAVPSAW